MHPKENHDLCFAGTFAGRPRFLVKYTGRDTVVTSTKDLTERPSHTRNTVNLHKFLKQELKRWTKTH